MSMFSSVSIRNTEPNQTADILIEPDPLEADVSQTISENVGQESLQIEGTNIVTNELTSNSPMRVSSARMNSAMFLLNADRKYDRCVQKVKQSLVDLQMITSFYQVAEEHNLSAPLVAAFRATPGFIQAAKTFPNGDLFNIVPESRTAASNVAGLESLGGAEVQTTSDVKSNLKELVAAYQDVLSGLATTAQNLQAQVKEDLSFLESADITDEVIATLPVSTISHNAFTEILTKLEDHLTSINTFNVDDLRAHPETIKDEINALVSLTGELGGVLGIQIGEYGLSDSDKDASFEPSTGDFGEKEITKAGLIFYLNKANTILETLKSIGARKDELSEAAIAAANNVPDVLNSDDVNYGCTEHVLLLSCYTTLTTKLIRESIMVITMLLSTVDAVFNIDDGTQVTD